ncbi:isoprenylcysteine carboxylmethyltransferase family protein [Actinomycetospora endophytica]|uniref:Isoprenylcysteine carboxylmethyltransferase family protein n=1 Tax=Actinomycetospora endophytica TaxID=2291215 RepID=A0ABS8PEE3_9PSEU|nr:isoprenylcysteine carboxylmethyltransferase family protein [Actinomycetospora endophytica]MCD2196643.1 isoprenylcysteine carboxylmethyltransferase family protein [Actinomycetospora endophytica]
MGRRGPRRLRDTAWATAGVAGAFAGIRAMEAVRPEVIGEDSGAAEIRDGVGELTRAYFFSAGAIVVSPLLATSVRLPRSCGPIGLLVQFGAVGLRVWAMRTLRGHYARTLRVVDGQPVVRSGPYRSVRHPGYLSVLLLWAGAALTARNALAPALTLTAVGTAYQHRMDAEDALLLRDLPGYAEYVETTRRMVPRLLAPRSGSGRHER